MGSRLIETILWCVKLIGRMMILTYLQQIQVTKSVINDYKIKWVRKCFVWKYLKKKLKLSKVGNLISLIFIFLSSVFLNKCIFSDLF